MRIQDKYYIINEKNRYIVIFDIEKMIPYKILSAKEEFIFFIDSVNRNPDDNNSLFRLLRFKCPEIFTDEKEILNTRYLNDLIEKAEYAVPMEKSMLEIDIKANLLYTEVVLLSSDINQYKYTDNINYTYMNEKNFELKKDALYIVDEGGFDNHFIKKTEEIFAENEVSRLYISETEEEIIVGPGLFGNDYGCRICQKRKNGNYKINRYISKDGKDLIRKYLRFELPYYQKQIVELIKDDIYLTKGKIFTVNKNSFDAKLRYVLRDINCPTCGRRRNEAI